MHELSLAEGILDIVRQYAPGDRAARVTGVKVRVGRLSSVVPDSLAFCFEAIVSDTPYARARLDIEPVPTACRCESCHLEFDADDIDFTCPSCASGNVTIVGGTDLQVVHLELSEDSPSLP